MVGHCRLSYRGVLLVKTRVCSRLGWDRIAFSYMDFLFPGQPQFNPPAGIVTGIGYGYVIAQAGWQNVWAGISGYGIIPTTAAAWPAWGTIFSWVYIISGSGIYLLITAAFLIMALFRIEKKDASLLGGLLISGLGLFAIPWIFLHFSVPGYISQLVSSKYTFLKLGIQLCSAPETLLLSGIVIVQGFHWFNNHHEYSINRKEIGLALVLIYSGFAAVRFFFNPNNGLFGQYADTLVPALIFIAIEIIPQFLAREIKVQLNLLRWQTLIIALLCTVTIAGYFLAQKNISYYVHPIATSRGAVLTTPISSDWQGTYQFLTQHTQAGDPIAVLSSNPEFSFLSQRKNVLRQDYFRAFYYSPEEVNDMIRRLKTSPPRVIIAKCWVTDSQAVLSGATRIQTNEWVNYLPSLAPVWQFVTDNYQVGAVFNPNGWGFVVFVLQNTTP
jgi:hypothetical protein